MEDLFQILEATGITLAIISPGIAAIIGYMRSKFNCIKELRKDFEDFKDQYGDRQLRHSKAFIILANRMDQVNKSQHPDRSALHLGDEIETILKDEHGNL
jgi:hypothetical protein